MIQRKTLIKNGYVITMDSQRTTLSRGEVLIGDDVILAIGHNLPQDDAEIIDAEGGIIMPGFVDNHRHMWQTNLRAMLADWTLHEYMRGIRFSISPVLRAEDIGAANYVGALEAMNAGVTTVSLTTRTATIRPITPLLASKPCSAAECGPSTATD